MSLLHPTTGELIDRMIVLRLKMARAQQDFPHLKNELAEIEYKLLPFTDKDMCFLVGRLLELHDQLWNLVQTDSSHRLLKMNRRRHELREEIDRLTGEYKGPEKV